MSGGTDTPRKDLGWLAIAVAGALLVHFGWTVPWGPFEASPRNQIHAHERFAKLLEKDKAFDQESVDPSFAKPMAFVVKRAVQLARTRLLGEGQKVWLEVDELACRSTRCRFSVCSVPGFPAKQASRQAPDKALELPLQRALEHFELGRRKAWELDRIEGPGCPRFEVRFVQLPRSGCLMRLSSPKA